MLRGGERAIEAMTKTPMLDPNFLSTLFITHVGRETCFNCSVLKKTLDARNCESDFFMHAANVLKVLGHWL